MDDELILVETEKPPKERVKLTHSTWAKVGAVVLLYVFLLGLAICVACFAANVAGWGDAEYVQKYVINELDFTDPSAMTLTRIIWNVSTFCGASAYVGTLCILLALACLIFLFCAAGHRKRETEPRLSQLDRIPLDLYAAAVVGASILLIFVIGDVLRWNMPSGYAAIMQMVFIFAFIGCASFGLVLALLLSFATRVKCGKWWRNTVIYCVLRLIWRAVKAVWHGIGRIGRMIPIVWRTALIMLGLYIIGFILFILMYDESGGWLLVGLLFSIVIYAAAIFGAWQMKGIKKAGQQLAEGKFDEKIDTKHMYWEFKSHAENLNSIGDGLAKEVAQRMKSERLKTELITNVSHDIKTPLTSIINYADLLQKAKTEEERAEYLAVLERQSQRLKKLTEDLVEASKASTGNMSVNLAPTNTQEIINQSYGEYSSKLEAGRLNTVINIPEPAPAVMADGRLLWRVIDNLFNNVVKYALPETRVYVDVRTEGAAAVISMKNISRAALNVSAEELMERFVRGDASRHTEGSGLGLNIAKSLTELQHGEFSISTDGDLFKAEIRLPLA